MGLSELAAVLFLNQYAPPDEAATSQLLGDLTDAAVARGCFCRVVASDRCYADPKIRYPRREVRNGVEFVRVPATGFGRASRVGRVVDYAAFVLGAARVSLMGPRAKVVVAMSTPPILGALGVLVARLRAARSVYWTMDVYPDIAFRLGAMREASLLGRLTDWVSRWTLRNTDLVIALGESMAVRLRQLGARNVAVVHNWSDVTPLSQEASDVAAFRAERGWGDRFVVLYSGNMGLAHEFETLLDAAEKLREDASVLFAFVGGGPRRAEVEAEVARRRLPNVTFHPSVPRAELSASLAAADLHVVTLRPGLPGLLVPSKIYGILAAARPVLYVGPQEGEVYEIIRECDCGEPVTIGDVEGILASIRKYRDPCEAGWAGARGRAMFKARYTRDGQTSRLLDLLEDLCRA